jgi:hypothetical protein
VTTYGELVALYKRHEATKHHVFCAETEADRVREKLTAGGLGDRVTVSGTPLLDEGEVVVADPALTARFPERLAGWRPDLHAVEDETVPVVGGLPPEPDFPLADGHHRGAGG